MRQYIQREKYISREKIGRERADKTDWYLKTSKELNSDQPGKNMTNKAMRFIPHPSRKGCL